MHILHREGVSGSVLIRKGEERNMTTSVRGSKGSAPNIPLSYVGKEKKKEGRDNGPNSNSFEGGVEDQPREMGKLFTE